MVEMILVVDDEEDIRRLLGYALTKEGFDVHTAATGEEALMEARELHPNLLILDLMLPGLDGLEVCRLLKRNGQTASIPVIMLTAKGGEADVVRGLETGADDYVSKPFSTAVLLARVRSLLRRSAESRGWTGGLLERGMIKIHKERHEVLVADESVVLTGTEFDILLMLAEKPGWVMTRNQIIKGARGYRSPVTERSVDVHVTSLRKKLGKAGSLIETVRGVGYRFSE